MKKSFSSITELVIEKNQRTANELRNQLRNMKLESEIFSQKEYIVNYAKFLRFLETENLFKLLQEYKDLDREYVERILAMRVPEISLNTPNNSPDIKTVKKILKKNYSKQPVPSDVLDGFYTPTLEELAKIGLLRHKPTVTEKSDNLTPIPTDRIDSSDSFEDIFQFQLGREEKTDKESIYQLLFQDKELPKEHKLKIFNILRSEKPLTVEEIQMILNLTKNSPVLHEKIKRVFKEFDRNKYRKNSKEKVYELLAHSPEMSKKDRNKILRILDEKEELNSQDTEEIVRIFKKYPEIKERYANIINDLLLYSQSSLESNNYQRKDMKPPMNSRYGKGGKRNKKIVGIEVVKKGKEYTLKNGQQIPPGYNQFVIIENGKMIPVHGQFIQDAANPYILQADGRRFAIKPNHVIILCNPDTFDNEVVQNMLKNNSSTPNSQAKKLQEVMIGNGEIMRDGQSILLENLKVIQAKGDLKLNNGTNIMNGSDLVVIDYQDLTSSNESKSEDLISKGDLLKNTQFLVNGQNLVLGNGQTIENGLDLLISQDNAEDENDIVLKNGQVIKNGKTLLASNQPIIQNGTDLILSDGQVIENGIGVIIQHAQATEDGDHLVINSKNNSRKYGNGEITDKHSKINSKKNYRRNLSHGKNNLNMEEIEESGESGENEDSREHLPLLNGKIVKNGKDFILDNGQVIENATDLKIGKGKIIENGRAKLLEQAKIIHRGKDLLINGQIIKNGIDLIANHRKITKSGKDLILSDGQVIKNGIELIKNSRVRSGSVKFVKNKALDNRNKEPNNNPSFKQSISLKDKKDYAIERRNFRGGSPEYKGILKTGKYSSSSTPDKYIQGNSKQHKLLLRKKSNQKLIAINQEITERQSDLEIDEDTPKKTSTLRQNRGLSAIPGIKKASPQDMPLPLKALDFRRSKTEEKKTTEALRSEGEISLDHELFCEIYNELADEEKRELEQFIEAAHSFEEYDHHKTKDIFYKVDNLPNEQKKELKNILKKYKFNDQRIKKSLNLLKSIKNKSRAYIEKNRNKNRVEKPAKYAPKLSPRTKDRLFSLEQELLAGKRGFLSLDNMKLYAYKLRFFYYYEVVKKFYPPKPDFLKKLELQLISERRAETTRKRTTVNRVILSKL